MADSVIRTPLSPALSSAPSGTPPSDIDSPRQLVSPGAGRQRSVSLIEAEEKRERLREKERADAHSGNGVEGDERADRKISAIELRAEVGSCFTSVQARETYFDRSRLDGSFFPRNLDTNELLMNRWKRCYL
jgi:hypothetical protein